MPVSVVHPLKRNEIMPRIYTNVDLRTFATYRSEITRSDYQFLSHDPSTQPKTRKLRDPLFQPEFDIVKNMWKNKNFKGSTLINYKVRCPSCGKMKNIDEMAEITDIKYTSYCFRCTEGSGNYRKCPICGKFYAQSCTCNHRKGKNQVLRYNAKIDAKFYKKNKSDNIFFGIELEVELNGKPLGIMKPVDDLQWLYYKHDGSMADGVEIVTHPLGWQWIKSNPDVFDPIFNMAKLGITSRRNDTCGMHVHLPKNIFTTLHLFKFMKFFHDNIDYITYISERSYDDMQRWSYFDSHDRQNLWKYARNKSGNERHSGINLTNPETVEVRVFKGTLSKISFFKNIEFVKAVYDYTKNVKLGSLASSELEFENFVEVSRKEYPNLIKFINIKKR